MGTQAGDEKCPFYINGIINNTRLVKYDQSKARMKELFKSPFKGFAVFCVRRQYLVTDLTVLSVS